jgi:hypothetical protein
MTPACPVHLFFPEEIGANQLLLRTLFYVLGVDTLILLRIPIARLLGKSLRRVTYENVDLSSRIMNTAIFHRVIPPNLNRQ